MKLDNQKNGWKRVCVYQEANGDRLNCPVRALLSRRYLHLRKNGATKTTIILAYFNEGRRYDVTSGHVSSALTLATGALEYPTIKGIHRMGEYALTAKWWRLCLGTCRIFGHPNPKNGTLARGQVQRIFPEQTSMLLVWYVL
jgi:hypothetical protein